MGKGTQRSCSAAGCERAARTGRKPGAGAREPRPTPGRVPGWGRGRGGACGRGNPKPAPFPTPPLLAMAPALLLIPAALASFILAFGTGVEFVRFTSLRPLLGRISESGSPGEREGRRMSSRVGRWSRSRGSVGRGLETNDRGRPGEGTRALKAAETRPRRLEG